MQKIITTATVIALAACGQSEPRSVQFFESHLDEARAVVDDCQKDTASSAECENAGTAVETAEAREKFKRFRGK